MYVIKKGQSTYRASSVDKADFLRQLNLNSNLLTLLFRLDRSFSYAAPIPLNSLTTVVMLAVLLKGWDPPRAARTTRHFPRDARRVASDTPRADPAVWSRVMNYLYEITMADDSE